MDGQWSANGQWILFSISKGSTQNQTNENEKKKLNS